MILRVGDTNIQSIASVKDVVVVGTSPSSLLDGAPISSVLWMLAANSSHLYSGLEVCPWLLEAGGVEGYMS